MKQVVRRKPLIGINVNFFKDPEKPLSAGECKVGFLYLESIKEAGGAPFMVPCGQDMDALRRYVDCADGFVFIGGADYPPALYREDPVPEFRALDPRRVETDLRLARLVRERGLPVLGICGGHQLLNLDRGGGLIQHIPRAEHHRRAPNAKRRLHWAQVTSGRILRRIFGRKRFVINSSHHQALDPERIGEGLRVTALAADHTIEAVEGPAGKFVLGVQWHPESMPNVARQRAVFAALIAAATPCARGRL